MLPAIEDVGAAGVAGQKPYLHFLADELHGRIVAFIQQVDGGIPVYVPDHPVMEGFVQPFPGLRSADPAVCRHVSLQRTLPRAAMLRGIVPADVFRKQSVELIQALNLRHVQPIEPPFFECPKIPFHLSFHCGLRGCTGMCPILGHELDKKRGNVFYDVKISYLRNDLNGTLFEGQVDTQIIKGKKLFDHPVSMDICKICARLCQDRIKDKMRTHYFTQLFFSEYHGRYFSFEIQNVRAGQRESRDLMQDLEDIRNGIQIIHASDAEKRNKENKKERRQKLRESAIRRLEKKLLENGYESLEKFSADRRHADKWLGEERIAELEKMRLEKEKERKEQPVQLSLFDMEAS